MAKQPADRKTELSKYKKIKDELLKGYTGISKSYEDAAQRINDNLDYWAIMNCEMDNHQNYNGNNNCYVPIVHDAIEARKTRYVNQVFPQSGRYVEVVTDDEELPDAQIALIDHYVDFSHLRDVVLPALMKNGDVEGQWNIYVDWQERTRYVTTKKRSAPEVDGIEMAAADLPDEETFDDLEEAEVLDFGPAVEVLPDNDVMVVPAIADSVDEALYRYGGSVTILRRWSDEMIRKKIKDGEIDEDAGEELLDRLKNGAKADNSQKDAKKHHTDSAGIKNGGKYALVYETWKVLEVDEKRRLTKTYFGGDNLILACRINPFWCDLCPLISAPVDKVSGSFKGISKVKPVQKMQYMANDYMNQGADSASYALLPIIATDPNSNPRVESMVIDLAAVWEVDPDKTKFMEFPKLWQDSIEIVKELTQQVFQTLSVNPSMISQRSSSKKPTQAEIAAEQQIDVLATADVIIPFEAGVLTPMVERFIDYDAQFRKEGIWVKAFGKQGMKTQMQEIPPQQMGNRVRYKWFGAEQARTAQQMQMQVSFANVLMKIPPQMMPGRKLDISPLIERACENIYGPHLAPMIFKPISDLVGMPPQQENMLLAQNIDLPVEPNDDDREHLMVHSQGQKTQATAAHIWKHQQQMAQKNQAAAAQAQQQGGAPGQGGPQAGAQNKAPTGAKAPPGALRPAQMPTAMPQGI